MREDLQESLRSDPKRARSDDGSAVGQIGYDTSSQTFKVHTPRGRADSSKPSSDLTPSFVVESQPQVDPCIASGVSGSNL